MVNGTSEARLAAKITEITTVLAKINRKQKIVVVSFPSNLLAIFTVSATE